jgi:hypothetical protein
MPALSWQCLARQPVAEELPGLHDDDDRRDRDVHRRAVEALVGVGARPRSHRNQEKLRLS